MRRHSRLAQIRAATSINAATLVPNFRSLPTIAGFATMALAYSGLELGPILGGEIKNPRRTIARALLIACVAIGVLYIAGTAALLMALPAQQINAISGIPQALTAVAPACGTPGVWNHRRLTHYSVADRQSRRMDYRYRAVALSLRPRPLLAESARRGSPRLRRAARGAADARCARNAGAAGRDFGLRHS